jgi:hypothetical protein
MATRPLFGESHPVTREERFAHMTASLPPLLTLRRGQHDGLWITPRWPSSTVVIDRRAWTRLLQAQAALPPGVRLIITRAFEPAGTQLSAARIIFRRLGICLFRLCYAQRINEIEDLFGANGHHTDGTHVDLSIQLDGHRLRFLPLGVFTPGAWQRRRVKPVRPVLEQVKQALRETGFSVHRNQTESLQIHCDLICQRVESQRADARSRRQPTLDIPTPNHLDQHRRKT